MNEDFITILSNRQILRRNKKLNACFLFTASIKDFRDGYHGKDGY